MALAAWDGWEHVTYHKRSAVSRSRKKRSDCCGFKKTFVERCFEALQSVRTPQPVSRREVLVAVKTAFVEDVFNGIRIRGIMYDSACFTANSACRCTKVMETPFACGERAQTTDFSGWLHISSREIFLDGLSHVQIPS